MLTFGEALEALKQGKRVARKGWNGKGMFIALQYGSNILPEQARGGVAKAIAKDGATIIKICPHIDMKDAQNNCVVGWLASQTDMLAEDWEVL